MAKKKKTSISSQAIFMLAILALFLVIAFFMLFSNRSPFSVLAGADKQAPILNSISINEGEIIGDGQTRLDNIQINADVSDESGVHRVTLYVDGEMHMGFSNYNSETWRTHWFVKNFDNGPHLLEIYLIDYRKNETKYAFNVTLNNGAQTDFTPPTITLYEPDGGILVKRNSDIPIKGKITDSGTGVAWHETQVWGKTQWTNFNCKGYGVEELSCLIHAQGKSGTEIKFKVDAYDREGNVSTITRSVFVK